MLGKVIATFVLALPLIFILRSIRSRPSSASATASSTDEPPLEIKTSVMQPAKTDLNPPKDDPFTLEQLRQFDGSDPSKPIYVSIKGTVFDVTRKADTYGPGKAYNLFCGKDASRALGMSSLKEEDAVPDYSTLSEADMKTLNDWYSFFSQRYNIVGQVTDIPPFANAKF